MATRTVVLDRGSGPDWRDVSAAIYVSRVIRGAAGDTLVYPTPRRVPVTNPPSSIDLEVGQAYTFDTRTAGEEPITAVIGAGAGVLLLKDLVPVDPATLEPETDPGPAWFSALQQLQDGVETIATDAGLLAAGRAIEQADIPGQVTTAVASAPTVVAAAEAALDAAADGLDLVQGDDFRLPQGSNNTAVAFSIVDGNGRRSWVEIDVAGLPTDHALKQWAKKSGLGTEQRPDSSGVAFSITDPTGRRSWLEIGPDGGPTAHSRRFLGSAAATPLLELAAQGDSTTEGLDVVNASQRWTNLLAAALGIPVYNRGSSGARSDDIAARMGAIAPTATVAVGTISGSGATTLTGLSVDPLRGSGPTSLTCTLRTPDGTLIPGSLSKSGTDRLFTRTTPGADIAVSTNLVDLFCSTGANDRRRILIFGAGINDEDLITAGTRTVEDVKRVYTAVASHHQADRKLLWGPLDRGPAEAVGTVIGNYIRDLESWLTLTYGTDFVPLRKYLSSSRALADAAIVQPGFVPTSADTDAVAAGVVPPSYRTSAGSVHLKELGHLLQARLFARHIRSPQKGWV